MRPSVQSAGVEAAVDEVMNGLVAYGRPVAIVLDDLHTVRSERSLRSLAHAIERLPANARMLAATRSDPAIPLARLRARRGLTEIRAVELAFTVDEARELIVREGVALSGESVELLVERTEGWPAGLYLAALLLRDLEDPDEGVRSFAGSTRHVADYLTDEVLSALAPQTKDFLVRTSALDRFTPELCDAVLGREDSAAVLAELARSNMFLVALDAREQWYRYHHLFGEALQLELGREDAAELRRTRGGVVPCAGSYRGRDRVRRRRRGHRDGRRASRGARPRVRFWRAADAVSWLGAPASLRAAGRAPVAAGGRGGGRGAARAPRGRRSAAARGGRACAAGAAAAVVAVRRDGRGNHPGDADRARRRGRGRRPRSSRGRGRSRGRRRPERRRARGPRAGAVLRRRARRDAADRNAGRRAARRARPPRRVRRRPRAARPGRRRARANRERGGVGSSSDQLRTHAIPSGLLDCVTRAPRACAGVHRDGTPRRGRARGAARRASAPLASAHRRSRACPARARAASASRGRGWTAPPTTSSARNGQSRGFPIRDGYQRSRPPSSRTSPPPE